MPYRDQTLFEAVVDEVRSSSGWFIVAWAASAAAHVLLVLLLMQLTAARPHPRRNELPPLNIIPVKPDERIQTLRDPQPEWKWTPDDADPERPFSFLPAGRPEADPFVDTSPDDLPKPPDIDPFPAPDDSARDPFGKDPVLIVADPFPNGSGEPVGGGIGPDFKGRGRRRNSAPPATVAAVELGLKWLARVQEPDGHWDAAKWGAGSAYDLGVTGLATLAFLGAGYTHTGQYHSPAVAKALNWMVERQQPDGNLGWKTFYEQGIASMALSEDAAMTGTRKYREAAQKAVNHIVAKMAPDGGFGYGGPGNDTSVTGWQIMALKSAIYAGLDVPAQAIERSKTYLAKSINPDGSTGYRYNAGGGPAMTSVGLVCRLFLDYGLDDDAVQKAAGLIRQLGPQLANEYYTYYATLAMYQMGPKTSLWREWNEAFRDPLIQTQIRDQGPMQGSWDPAGKSYGAHGGRVYVTAMYVLSLEVYYRFLPIYYASAR